MWGDTEMLKILILKRRTLYIFLAIIIIIAIGLLIWIILPDSDEVFSNTKDTLGVLFNINFQEAPHLYK
jgi:hypothetical protein